MLSTSIEFVINMWLIYYLLFSITATQSSKTVDGSSTNHLGIVGGYPTDIIYHPWQVSIQENYIHFCGGILFTPHHVITAAHCVQRGIKNLNIRAGSTYRDYGGQVSMILNYTIHSNYDAITYESDIAVLRLTTDITHPNAKPAVLAKAGEVITAGAPLIVTGWGLTAEKGVGSPILLEMNVPVVNRPSCSLSYVGMVTNNMFCAGLPGGGKDSCSEDSGGPATIDGVVVGVVSFGNGCARPNFPGVYVKLANFRNWIDTFYDF